MQDLLFDRSLRLFEAAGLATVLSGAAAVFSGYPAH
jgi:hypothetical protein